MTRSRRWIELKRLMRAELHHLTTIHPSDRLWQMPFAAALATGLPLLVGAYFDHLDYGLITLGHTPPTLLIQARFFDTVLGSLVGLAGGICLHSPRFREVVGRLMRRLPPSHVAR